MNKATTNAFEALTKTAEDNSSGGDIRTAGPFRLLYEPKDGDNSYKGLAERFDRAELEAEWQSVRGGGEYTAHAFMKPAAQNDFVAAIHRDTCLRYTGRLQRILHESTRKANHIDPVHSIVANLQRNMTNFLALKGETE